MKRSTRTVLAKATVEIVERGTYQTMGGRTIDIANAVRECLNVTRYVPIEELEQIRNDALALPVLGQTATIEVVNETTLAGISRVLADGERTVLALNFASAKNPGGGFLNGSQVQEESLARSSALHASLQRAWDFYEHHRAMLTLLYSDAMILSPGCPIIRNDDGTLLDLPQLATFITCAAPNAGATANSRPDELPLIPEVFRRRSEYVLALASSQGYKHLVLGAWGCGVFRNNPKVVADAFIGHLRDGIWCNRFERVVFSVFDKSPSQDTFTAFQSAMG